MSLRRHVLGPALVLAGLVAFIAPVGAYWLVGRRLATDVVAPGGYQVTESTNRSLSLLWDAETDLATVTLRRSVDSTADRVGAEIEGWLTNSEGFEGRYVASRGQWFERARSDVYDADRVRYEIDGEGPSYSTVTLGLTVLDTDGLSLVPLTTALGVGLAFAGVTLIVGRHRTRVIDLTAEETTEPRGPTATTQSASAHGERAPAPAGEPDPQR
jgi:hypothetical protein